MAYKITEECIMCDACLPECPQEAITLGNPKYKVNVELCDDCGSCAEVCPIEACLPIDDDD